MHGASFGINGKICVEHFHVRETLFSWLQFAKSVVVRVAFVSSQNATLWHVLFRLLMLLLVSNVYPSFLKLSKRIQLVFVTSATIHGVAVSMFVMRNLL